MSLDSFFVSRCTEEETERRNRIRLSVAAYAYEVHDDPIMSDSEFDDLANKINVQKTTGNEIMDDFFREEFSPHTGQWIHKHPNKLRLENIYTKYFSRKL
jgi:hypothetical protein